MRWFTGLLPHKTNNSSTTNNPQHLQHLKRLFKATDRYYRNEHLENVATSHLPRKRTTARA